MGDETWPSYATNEEKSYNFKPLEGKSLRIRVKAAHDCHVCFSPVDEDNEDNFEVFIGGWEGNSSAIRFKKDNDLDKVDTPDILNDQEVREFWITFDDDIVKVGRGDEWKPFMTAQLPEHIEVGHFGYSTGWGAIGWWQFPHELIKHTEDCPTYNYEPIYGTSLLFNVSCGNDAHIALTSAAQDTEVMYEIFIGGWGNSHSAIRLNKDKELTVAKVETPDIACGEGKTFWLTFKDGRIRVGEKGNQDPFMEYIDSSPWEITHYGYCTAWGASGTWKMEL